MADNITITVDETKGTLRVKGGLILGGVISVATDAADGTVFFFYAHDAEGNAKAVATHALDDAGDPIPVASGAFNLDLSKAALREAFADSCARSFEIYATRDGRTTAKGHAPIAWSPLAFEADGRAVDMKGERGEAGSDGKSAYDLAVENGFKGSVAKWLASLKGADGKDGSDGKDGEKGEKGDTGATGAQGPKGDTPDMSGYATIEQVDTVEQNATEAIAAEASRATKAEAAISTAVAELDAAVSDRVLLLKNQSYQTNTLSHLRDTVKAIVIALGGKVS